MDDIFKKKSNDIFSKKVIDVFENKSDNDILAPRSGGIDVFETREDIFENPGYQANIFPGDKETEYHEPTAADVLCHGKFRKNRCHAKVIQRTLELYMKGEDINMKKKPTANEPKRVTIKDTLEW
ncbi:Hypothetical predicted protein [Mytilus galloprovincialis]|uniref:Uncharacterized protein n=1 Tax=Mytilus galloprovincialis TaxID=29158 RepID=A0A8B6CDK7_MYTGA|nr:Hypothetical predicted protein [Mytilus galloprovincialis]